MKKKLMTLFLAVTMACSLAACGSVSSSSTEESSEVQEGSNGKAVEETVEITMDNWQEYFEVVKGPSVETNAFDEIEMLYVKTVFVIKDEYADKLVDCDIALEYTADEAKNYIADYKTDTEELTLTEDASNGAPLMEEAWTETIEVTGTDAAEGAWFPEMGGTYTDSVKVSDDGANVTASCWTYSNVQVTRIKGTLELSK